MISRHTNRLKKFMYEIFAVLLYQYHCSVVEGIRTMAHKGLAAKKKKRCKEKTSAANKKVNAANKKVITANKKVNAANKKVNAANKK